MSDIPRLSRSLPNTPTAPPVRMVIWGSATFTVRTRRGTPRTRPTQSSGGLPGSQVGEPTWRKRSPPKMGSTP